MNDSPVISVVMSVYNGERFLREAVESILNQSFLEFEFIIINDGSTDGSAAILKSYQSDRRVRVYDQENRGLIESLNRGCKLARGKYIARMDADDVSLKDRLAKQVDLMEKHPQIGVMGGATEWIDANGKALTIIRNASGDRELRAGLLRGNPLCHSTVLMRKDAFDATEGYRAAIVDAEDYDLWCRISDHFQLANLEEVVVKYRIHPGQISVRKCRQQTLSFLAAKAAAVARREGKPDPLDWAGKVTPAMLVKLGVSEAEQEKILAEDHLQWIRLMHKTGEHASGLAVASEMMGYSKWQYAERWVMADIRLLTARMYWKQGQFGQSALSLSRAILGRPAIAGRPFKPLLKRLRPARTASGAV
jgi:glycosyltransferase involved in cell wall biosynthesis